MPRPKSDRKNEIKTRVNDRVYGAFVDFMQSRGIESESDAVAVLLEFALLGLVGADPRTKAIVARSQ